MNGSEFAAIAVEHDSIFFLCVSCVFFQIRLHCHRTFYTLRQEPLVFTSNWGKKKREESWALVENWEKIKKMRPVAGEGQSCSQPSKVSCKDFFVLQMKRTEELPYTPFNMLLAPIFLLGWALLCPDDVGQCSMRGNVTYFADPGVYQLRLREWGFVVQRDAQTTRECLLRSLAVWEQHPSAPHFVQLSECDAPCTADIHITATTDIPTTVAAQTLRFGSRQNAVIEVPSNGCWHMESRVCAAIEDPTIQVLYAAILWVSIATGLMSIPCIALAPCAVCVGLPALFAATLTHVAIHYRCSCTDMASMFVHEIGHVLGLDHPRQGNNWKLACNATAEPAAYVDSWQSRMLPLVQKWSTTCLELDDVNALDALYESDNCHATRFCAGGEKYVGDSHLYIVFAGAVLLGLLVAVALLCVTRRLLPHGVREE